MPPNEMPVNISAPISVSALNRRVREQLEAGFPLLWVKGEISNLTQAASGHLYFTLKDAQAQVRCVMWRGRAQTLGWRPAQGQQVEARALVSFYEPRGEFQLTIESLRQAGQGDLFERFNRLKAQLMQEGLFDSAAKRPLPDFARHIAIVTSLQAAALRDVLTTLRRRAPHVRISLYPTLVQGDGAAEQIVRALQAADRGAVDVILLCRGGGSIEDLWAFNEEIVARAIRATQHPVVSGIGHETDFTIADFAADLRAPTPTAAAELASPDRAQWLALLTHREQQLARALTRQMGNLRQQLDWLSSRLVHPAERLTQRQNALKTLVDRMRRAWAVQHAHRRLQAGTTQRRLRSLRPRGEHHRQRLQQQADRLVAGLRWQFSRQHMKLAALSNSLKQLDPLAVMARGYALVTLADGRIVRDAQTLAPSQPIRLSFARGKAEATVTRVVAPDEAE